MKHPGLLFSLVAVVGSLLFEAPPDAGAAQVDLIGPPGSGTFGRSVSVMPNGNFVVTDPDYDAPGGIRDVGAVYLYDGITLAVISTLKGSKANDLVGNGEVTVLSSGNFVVHSLSWNAMRGAVTWGSGTTGVSGVVSAANSLVGSTASDQIGFVGGASSVTILSNGNYVVRSPRWDNGTVTDAGAVTWGNGMTGVSGAVSAVNSLVGSTANDGVGGAVVALSNGNYVVISQYWDNGSVNSVGAVTWGSGTTGVIGAVSAANSLVGSTTGDLVGNNGVIPLSNGNYVVSSLSWDNGGAVNAGAATWGSGTTGVSGVVSAANSLVGTTAHDFVDGRIVALNNGNYVVGSPNWDTGAVTDAGAVTWGDGATGVSGAVSVANSLVGSSANDLVGNKGVTPLNNGNYVVGSPKWDNGTVTDAGAVTWGNGATGMSGAVSAANSLVGITAFDGVGSPSVTPLENGNYVVSSGGWDSSAVADAGAATWGNGMTGVFGAISTANSLVGGMANDGVGNYGVTPLSNGNYVVLSSVWNNGAVSYAGAVTWGSGTTGVSGVVSATNSLVGSSASDRVGAFGVTPLSSGNYVVCSSSWNSLRGAVTWGSGTTGVSGVVSAANSLVGSSANDQIGSVDGVSSVTILSNGNYLVRSFQWDNGAAVNAGAVTWGSGTTGVTGAVSAANSLVGSTAYDVVGIGGVAALSNGNYVVGSGGWDNGAVPDAGAVTWGNGTTGVSGAVSAANSLVGSTAYDVVGNLGVTPLTNGNYVVRSDQWDNGSVIDAGAATWGNGATGVFGAVSMANSLVGSTGSDRVSIGPIGALALSDGNYLVLSRLWDNGAIVDAGAYTLGDGTRGTSGPVAAANSVVGTLSGDLSFLSFAYDPLNSRLIVGRPAANRVSLLSLGSRIDIAIVPTGTRLRFTGSPGRTFNIERAPAANGLWGNTIASPIAPPSGLIEYIDTSAPIGSGFYRTRTP